MQISTQFSADLMNWITYLLFTAFVIYITFSVLRRDDRRIDVRDLICDWQTNRLDYKKVALCTCAILQCFTWGRMSMGLPVNVALANPLLWIAFYMVIAAHDLLARFVKAYATHGTAIPRLPPKLDGDEPSV